MPVSERWTALVDDAVHEINMRWGVRLDDSDEPDTEPMDQIMVRETAEAILRPVEAEVDRLREELGDAVDQARLFNRGGLTWLEYDALLVRWEGIANAS